MKVAYPHHGRRPLSDRTDGKTQQDTSWDQEPVSTPIQIADQERAPGQKEDDDILWRVKIIEHEQRRADHYQDQPGVAAVVLVGPEALRLWI